MQVSLACRSSRAQAPGTSGPPVELVPAAGTSRRLRALAYMAHSAGALAAALPIPEHVIRRLQRDGQGYIPRDQAQAVSALYEDLWNVRGTSDRTGRLARRARWTPPLGWDEPGDHTGHDIDDPAATEADWRPRLTTVAERAQDIAEILGQGYTLTQAGWRLGVHRKALEAVLRRSHTEVAS